MSTPWVSVIVPTYNGATYLGAALESLVAQEAEGLEVIAVDDGSTDSTVEILQSFQSKLVLKIIRRTHGGNWVASTNCGLAAAAGDYVSLLHQDDLWMADRLHVVRSLISQAPDVSMIVHASWFIDADGHHVGQWRCPLPARKVLPGSLVRERLLIQNFIAAPAPLVSRRVALDVGGLDEDLWYSADWDFWLKVASRGSIFYIPSALTGFRLTPESQTMTRSGASEEFRRQLEIVLQRHLPAPPVDEAVQRAARFSVSVNTAMAAWIHDQPISVSALISQFLTIGPSASLRYVRDSRIFDRVSGRVRMRLKPGSAKKK